MKFTKEDFEKIALYHTIPTSEKGYIIKLGNKTFESNNGKSIFRKRRSAISALKQSLRYAVCYRAEEKLIQSGVSPANVYNHEDFLNYWDNFFKQATESGFLKIIELK